MGSNASDAFNNQSHQPKNDLPIPSAHTNRILQRFMRLCSLRGENIFMYMCMGEHQDEERAAAEQQVLAACMRVCVCVSMCVCGGEGIGRKCTSEHTITSI